jgi:hypothetical protein
VHVPGTLHGHQLEHADKANYLGVTIQSDLKWDSHINSITTKANKTLGFLPRRESDLRSARLRQLRCSIMLLTLEVL